MKAPLIALLLCCFSFIAEGATYYVSPSGSDSNPGTKENPWKTARKASRGTRAGDTVYFRDGVHRVDNETYFYPKAENSGTPTQPITYTSYPNEKATLLYDVTETHSDRWIVYIPESVHDLVFDKLTIQQSEASRAFSISRCVSGSDADCDRSQWVDGISIRGARVKVKNCKILNTSGVGIGGANEGVIENNTISGSYTHAFYIGDHGKKGIWRNNTIDCSRGYYNQHCIQLQWAGNTQNEIYGNLVIGGQSSGIAFSGPITNNKVYNNIFVDCGKKPNWPGGGQVIGFYTFGGPIGAGNKFYNNTVLGAPPKTYLIDTTSGETVEVFNNIFRTSSPAAVGGSATFPIHHNIFFNTQGTVPPSNITADPKLTNTGSPTASAKLRTGSSAINAATTGAPSQDYFGLPRPVGKADIGAHEFITGVADGNTPTSPLSFDVK